MKKLLLIILILLPCELGAQEGCGWWFETKGCINLQHMLEDVDSVWVPKPCGELKCKSVEDRLLEIEARMNRLVYPYRGWTYGVESGCRGDTVVIYKHIDSVRIYSGERDTVMVWEKGEKKK